MSRKLMSLGVLAAAFTLMLGASDAQAKSWRSKYRDDGCCQSNNHSSHHHHHSSRNNNCCYQQVSNNCYQQTSYVTNACWNQQPTCGVQQYHGAVSASPMTNAAPPPPVATAPAPAPAPGF